jgi:hypothetical protein
MSRVDEDLAMFQQGYNASSTAKPVYKHTITAEDVERSSTLEDEDIGRVALYCNGAIMCLYDKEVEHGDN